MKEFITKNKIKNLFIIIFWLGIWQTVSMIFKKEILFVSPFQVLKAMVNSLGSADFCLSVLSTVLKVLLGFSAALACGLILAIMSYKSGLFRDFIYLPMLFIKSVPAVSFIIILLLVFRSEFLPAAVSFIMVLPIIYLNVYKGLESVDKNYLKMALIYRVSMKNKIKYIYMSTLKPFLYSGISLGIGLAFKSGLAAEVIALPRYGIGTLIYSSKIYLDTADLFAYTISAVFIAYIFEKIVLYMCGRILK